MTETKPTALIIDANSLIHRAWHALPPLTAPDGRLVNAVYGFTSVLMKILSTERPDYLVACWDTVEPTYRHKARPEYKAQREKQPQEFYDQMPLVKEAVKIFGGANVELPGYEADDLLATLAGKLAKKDVEVTLLTSDRDVWQAIGPGIKVVTFKKGVSETVVYDENALKNATGLTVHQQADFKALRGDPSDNLKGVAGIGEKTATELLIEFKDLEGVLKAAHDSKSDLTPSVRRRLLEGEKEARDILPLVRLVGDAPVKETANDLKRRLVDEEELRRFFTVLGFKSLLVRALGAKEKKSLVRGFPGKEKQSPAASRHILSPTAHDFESFFAAVRKEGELIVRLAESEQQSLFQDAVVALGSKQMALIIPQAQLKSAKFEKLIASVLGDPAIKKIGHGLKKFWHWAKKNSFEFEGIDFDTEIAAYILAGGEGSYDLCSLAAVHLKMVLPEGAQRALYEIDAIRGVRAALSEALKSQGLDRVVERFESPLISVLAKMEDRGILIDRKYFSGLTEDFRKEKRRLEREMEQLAGAPFNPASPQQLVRVLFEMLKLPTKGIKRGKTGYSTASSELAKLWGAHPIIEKIADYREVAKLLSTYVEVLPALADKHDRVHTTFNQALTATGRLSSVNPNLQNIPVRTDLGRKIRRGFIAPQGMVLLSCDYSQIELRIAAALAEDKTMIGAFESGQDIHTATAAAIWGIAPKEVTKEQRRAAKAINFGIMYGQGPIGLSRAAGISFEEAQEFIARYFTVYSGVRKFLDQTKALAHSRGYVETLFGRRRVMSEINSPRPEFRAAAERMAINMPVQGTAADLIKLAMIEIDKQLSKISERSCMLLQVHDELLFEVLEKEAKKVASSIVDIMQSVEKIGVPIVVDAKVGKNWDEMENL